MDSDRGGLHNHVVEEPVAGCGERGTFGSHTQAVDFGRVEPGDRAPAAAEGDEEDADEDGGNDSRYVLAFVVSDLGADGDAEECDGLESCHGKEEGAASEPFDEEDTEGYGGHEADAVACCKKAGCEFGETDGLGEDEGEVVAENVDAGQLLAAELTC